MIKSIVLVADAYPPTRISAAHQLRDLALEFLRQGVIPTVITSDSGLQDNGTICELDGIKVLRLKSPKYRNIGKIRRAMAEILMPFFMIVNFKKSSLNKTKWDAVIWYSPTIFLGPFVWYLKRHNAGSSYLILRDIFPAWALDLGLIKKGFIYYFFKIFERFQYSIADCIGVQSVGNLKYFNFFHGVYDKKIEVLQNWLSPKPLSYCSVDISMLPISNRKIFVYAGNMGVAQGVEDLLSLAESLLPRTDIGFLFVGRGSSFDALKINAEARNLVNTVFCDEIDAVEIPGLYAQCHVGLIALHPDHKTHNIPGKFISYLQSGLPVMAIINDGNDLQLIIEDFQVGKATTNRNPKYLMKLAEALIDDINYQGSSVSCRCKQLSIQLFSSKRAVEQITNSLNSLH